MQIKRESSIHISRSKLVKVLGKLLPDKGGVKWDHTTFADQIIEGAKQYSLTNRQLVVDKAKLLKSTSKIVLSTRDDAGVFAQLLNLLRKKQNHRGINIIKVGSADWGMIKEIAHLAISFCNDFGLKREEGFKIYITIALKRMNKFNLARFNTYHQAICDEYAATEEIKNDLTPGRTQEAKNLYDKYLSEKTGIVKNHEPDKVVYFIKVKEEAKKYKVTIAQYIAAQFEGLEWANSYPDPSQLIGKGALDRLSKYLVKNKIKPGELSEDVKTQKAIDFLKKKWNK